jgi:hypothetical protein
MPRLESFKSRTKVLVVAAVLSMATLSIVGVTSAKTYSTKTRATADDVLLRAVQSAIANQQKHSKLRRASDAGSGSSPWFHCYCTPGLSSTGPFLGHCTCRWHISNCDGASTIYGDGSKDEPFLNCL